MLRLNLMEPCAMVKGTPMACRTWDGWREPEVQAEPEEAHIPCSFRSSRIASPSMYSKLMLDVLGRRYDLSPLTLLWGMIFNPQFGIMNWFLGLMGIKGPGWLASQQWALPALIIMSLWGVGGGMIIYLAGLQGIPTAFYEAAEIDGANSLQKLTRITVPLMTPVIFYNLVIGIIGTFQFFTTVYVLTSGAAYSLGGPAEATMFYNLYLYSQAFRYMNMGYASALAWILFVIVLILTLLVFRSSSMWVYYEGELKR